MRRLLLILIGTALVAFSVSYLQTNLSKQIIVKEIHHRGFQVVSASSAFFNGLGKLVISPFRNFAVNFGIENKYQEVLKLYEESQVTQLQYKLLVQENNLLREELRYRNQVLKKFKPISAEIVARGLDSWFDTVILDKGWKDGIEEDMPVVNTQGLVGRVVETSEHLSKVMLLINSNSSISSMVLESSDKGIIHGRGLSSLLLKYIPHSSGIKREMKVYTSGVSQVFPRGILIGSVSKVVKKKYDHLQLVEVRPAVNFAKLDRVWVITEKVGYINVERKLD